MRLPFVFKGTHTIFWIILALAGLAYSFIKIGALSVLVKVLSSALAVAVALLTLTGLTWLVRRLFKRKLQ